MKHTMSRIINLMKFLDDKLEPNDMDLRDVVLNELIDIAITSREDAVQEIATNQRSSIQELRKNKR